MKRRSHGGPCNVLVPHTIITSNKAENLNPQVITVIPEVYRDCTEEFSEIKAISLPPLRRYECAIDLLPGTKPPHNHIYSLSNRQWIMFKKPSNKVIFIHPLSSFSRFHLCGDKRVRTSSRYWLKSTESVHSETSLSLFTGPFSPGTT